MFCRHPWLMDWTGADERVTAAVRPPALRVCARAVRATRSPRAHGSLPYGQPSALVGLRIRAYSSPLRGLLPAAYSACPTPPSGLMQSLRPTWAAKALLQRLPPTATGTPPASSGSHIPTASIKEAPLPRKEHLLVRSQEPCVQNAIKALVPPNTLSKAFMAYHVRRRFDAWHSTSSG